MLILYCEPHNLIVCSHPENLIKIRKHIIYSPVDRNGEIDWGQPSLNLDSSKALPERMFSYHQVATLAFIQG